MSTASAPADAAVSDPGGGDVKRTLARGSFWTMFGYGAGTVVRLASNAILWRLLHPEAFGLMQLVNALLIGLAMFSEIGVGPSIVQNERGEDPDFLNTAWTMQVLRGFAIFGVGCALAVPFANFYERPEFAPLVPVVTLSAVVSGFNSTKLFTATRRMALRRMTMIDLGAQIAGLVVMITLAFAWRSVWALAWGGVAGAAIRCLMTHLFFVGPNNRFRWDKTAAQALFTFGRWMFASTLLTFLALNADKLIFGKLITIEELAVFGVAAGLATMPSFILGHTIAQVLFPLLSRTHQTGAPMRPFYLGVRRPVLIMGAWMTTCLIAGGPLIIELIYPPKAAAAGWIIQILAFGSWCAALENANSHAMLALGSPKWLAAANGAKVIALAALIPIGAQLGGFPGSIVALAVADVVKYAVSALAVHRGRIGAFGQDLVLSIGISAAALLGLAVKLACVELGLRGALSALGLSAIATTKVGALLEGAAVCLVVSAAWGGIFLTLRRRSRVAGAAETPTTAGG